MDVSALMHRDMEVWLSDKNGDIIPHGEFAASANTVSTSVQLPKGMDYVVHWRSHPGIAHTAFCEIFVPHRGKHFRAGTHFMDKDKGETQIRSSNNRLSVPFSSGLKSPGTAKKGYVTLEIRRARGSPVHTVNPNDPDGHLDEIDIDIIDDANENLDPFIIFRFEFIQTQKSATGKRFASTDTSGSKSTVPLKRKQSTTGLQSPPVSRRTPHQTPADRRQDSPQENRNLRTPSPLFSSRGNSALPQEGKSLVELLNAAKAEEEQLDAELREQLLATRKRIAEKKKLLGK